MNKLYIYLLLLLNLLNCKNLSQKEKKLTPYINEGIENKEYRISSLLPENYELFELIRGIEKEKLPYIYLLENNNILFRLYSRDSNLYVLEKYNIGTQKIDTIQNYGYIYPNGIMETKFSTINWIVTGDKKSISKITYLKTDSLPKSKTFEKLLKELYQKSEFTDYSNFEFRFYIHPQLYIVENRNKKQYSQEYMEKNFPVKQSKDAGFTDFKFPEAEKYYKELGEDNYHIISEKDIEAAQQLFPDNKEEREKYI